MQLMFLRAGVHLAESPDGHRDGPTVALRGLRATPGFRSFLVPALCPVVPSPVPGQVIASTGYTALRRPNQCWVPASRIVGRAADRSKPMTLQRGGGMNSNAGSPLVPSRVKSPGFANPMAKHLTRRARDATPEHCWISPVSAIHLPARFLKPRAPSPTSSHNIPSVPPPNPRFSAHLIPPPPRPALINNAIHTPSLYSLPATSAALCNALPLNPFPPLRFPPSHLPLCPDICPFQPTA